jgi:hypothetical protein
MRLTVALVAVTAAAAASAAVAAPPPPTVTCVVGGNTSFAHPPHGTTNVLLTYFTPTGGTVTFVQWTSGAKRTATPDQVVAGDSVVATFNDGPTPLDTAGATCS